MGAAESDELGYLENRKSDLQLHVEASYNALEDAGLKKSDVDAIFSSGNTLGLAEHMGIHPRFTDSTSVGRLLFRDTRGSRSCGHCGRGTARWPWSPTARRVTPGGSSEAEAASRAAGQLHPGGQFETPYGYIGAPINYSMACARYMYEFGEDRCREAMAEIAVSTRKWAALNPRALIHDPAAEIPLTMSFDEYHNSRWISWPFHLLDCCLVTDAGGAYVITTPERARDLKKPPVWILGAGEGHDHGMISQMPSLTSLIARETGPRAFEMAGVSHDELRPGPDIRLIYLHGYADPGEPGLLRPR